MKFESKYVNLIEEKVLEYAVCKMSAISFRW